MKVIDFCTEGNALWAWGEAEVGSVNRNPFLPSPLQIDAEFHLIYYDHARVTYTIYKPKIYIYVYYNQTMDITVNTGSCVVLQNSGGDVIQFVRDQHRGCIYKLYKRLSVETNKYIGTCAIAITQ